MRATSGLKFGPSEAASPCITSPNFWKELKNVNPKYSFEKDVGRLPLRKSGERLLGFPLAKRSQEG
jgi:hypothetical protein